MLFLFVQIQLPQEGRGRTNVEHVSAYYAQDSRGDNFAQHFLRLCCLTISRTPPEGGGEKRENKKNNPSQERVLGLRRLRPPPPPRVECALSKQEGEKFANYPPTRRNGKLQGGGGGKGKGGFLWEIRYQGQEKEKGMEGDGDILQLIQVEDLNSPCGNSKVARKKLFWRPIFICGNSHVFAPEDQVGRRRGD